MTLARDVRGSLAIGAIGVLFMLIAPSFLELFTIINLTTAIALAVLALSLAFIWGYGGILCFGQNAFFGIGAYAYTIAAINFGGSSWAILVAILVAVAFAVIIGYVMFYGRVSDVYLAVITLTVTLILYSLIRRTSGPDYKIGKSLLGGFNGITSPPLNLPWDTSFILFPEHVFYVAMGGLVLAYLFTSWLTRTHFGRVCVSIRENELRAELLGYDVRLYKLAIFAVGAGIAGLAGVLFCNGVGRVTPDVFNLYNAALTIIWVIVGGRGTLIGPILGAFGLFYLTSALGTQSTFNNNLVLGIILVVFVLLVPKGVIPTLADWMTARRNRRALRARERRMRMRRTRGGGGGGQNAGASVAGAGGEGTGGRRGREGRGMRQGEVVLETRGLSMHFGGVRAVDRVDFALYENELRCLIGPNGAGKSTFFKCLTGQLRATAGSVVIRDIHVTDREPFEVAALGVGIKTQVPNVFEGLDVEENIWLSARRWHPPARARNLTAETLDRLRLGDIRTSPVGRLAHGQRQWVELGMVVAAEPWLVLLDEPAAGMTHEETVRTAELIREINRTATLIVVEHDMQFIRMISDLVTVFHEGRILMEDTMEAISADSRAREVYLGHRA